MKKKKHIVMARSEKAIQDGVVTSKGKLDFKGKSMMSVDADIANEIEYNQGLRGTGDVWTHEDPRRNWSETYKADGVHSFFFGSSPRYRVAWDEFEERRKARRHAAKRRKVSNKESQWQDD